MLITYEDAATLAKVSKTTIKRRVANNSLKTYRENGRSLVNDREVIAIFAREDTPPPPLTECRVIAVCNQKGGVGKTTTVANLSATLAQQGYRVLAIDGDPQANLTQVLGVKPENLKTSLFNVLVEDLPIEKATVTPVMEIKSLSLVAANLDLATAELMLLGKMGREIFLRDAIASQLINYDYIFIDSPPSLGTLTLNALSAATEVIIPLDMGISATNGASRLMDTITGVRRINPLLRSVRPLACMVDGTNLTKDILEWIRDNFQSSIYETMIKRNVKIAEAQTQMKPICLYKPNSEAAKAYVELAEEVKNKWRVNL